jgi:hypothetical protein
MPRKTHLPPGQTAGKAAWAASPSFSLAPLQKFQVFAAVCPGNVGISKKFLSKSPYTPPILDLAPGGFGPLIPLRGLGAT